MRYMGGKFRVAKHIAKIIQPVLDRADQRVFVEPFCGALNVTCAVQADTMIINDGAECLITLYKALINEWVPPDSISEQEYRSIMALNDPHDPLTAFAGFGCSFGSKMGGGYARNSTGRDYAGGAKRSLARKINRLNVPAIRWSALGYKDLVVPDGAVVYCDPPYAGTTGYKAAPPFHSEDFWIWAEELSQRCDVFVSEYVAPDSWCTIWEREQSCCLDGKNKRSSRRIEKLFYMGQNL